MYCAQEQVHFTKCIELQVKSDYSGYTKLIIFHRKKCSIYWPIFPIFPFDAFLATRVSNQSSKMQFIE
jgi:hypothetical protein